MSVKPVALTDIMTVLASVKFFLRKLVYNLSYFYQKFRTYGIIQ